MKNVKDMTKIALFAAVIAVCSLITIPLPSGIPVTLQTFAVALAGFMLGWKGGTISVAVYLAIGAVGVPVFSGFTGGIAKFAGVTGGYLWGFLLMALLCGLMPRKRRVLSAALSLLGLACCHAAGTFQFAIISGSSPVTAFMTCSAPYLIKDILSVVLAYMTAEIVERSLRLRRA